jgi:hypothetical protein
MLAQLEVNELIPGLPRTSTDFHDIPVLEFFFQYKNFPGFSRPVDRKKQSEYGFGRLDL